MNEPWTPKAIEGVPDRVILFDGVCVLCSRWARFVIERDPAVSFRADAATAGRADINSPRRVLPWLICKLSGLPAPGRDVQVRADFHIDGRGGEFWRRWFAERRYQSGFAVGTGRHAGLLCERFFPYVFFHKLTPSAEGLRWDLVRWKLLFLPLPRWLMPIAVCFQSGDRDRFVFDIDAAFRIIGPVIHYRGWLAQQ